MLGKLSGKQVLATLLAVFAVVGAVNVLFIVKAYTTFSGEDEQRPYLQGVKYNQTLQRRALQGRLGWQGTVQATRIGRLSVKIVVHLVDRVGAPLSDMSLNAILKHPSDSRKDRSVALRAGGAGMYEGTASDVPSGAWDLDVASRNDPATPFEANERIWLH